MTGIVDWAASRARMVLAFIFLSIAVGVFAYISLPKEGEPDIEIPAVFISMPFQGISAADAETLLVKPMEAELAELDGLETMTSTAAEGYANVILEFEFGWDKTQVLADVRDAMNRAEADFPDGGDQYTLGEFNFSEFPIIIVSLSGPLPERTLSNVAEALQDEVESLDAVLEANITGKRDEMLEVVIDPLRLEAYNVTAGELINVVQNNNQLIAAGEIDGPSGTFAVKIPSSFDEAVDVYNLPVKTNGDRVVTLGDLAEINLTFEDRTSTARFNGDATIALQISKRKGFNLIDTADQIKELVAERQADWPEGLRANVAVEASNDQSRQVGSMVDQLEGSVLTAIILVMLVGLAALGIRASLLVGFAIPTSFLLCFVLLAIMGISISNIVMFGLILSVGMLVDGAIVVTEYADKRQQEGIGPMQSYVEAAKRMFWPVISSTATTLCAFLPMLFWPGVPGEFMGMLPVTLIFVLSASLIVALIYLPVMGGLLARLFNALYAAFLRVARLPLLAHLALLGAGAAATFAALAIPVILAGVGMAFGGMDGQDIWGSVIPTFATVFAYALALVLAGATAAAGVATILMSLIAFLPRVGIGVAGLARWIFGQRERRVKTGQRRTAFGRVIEGIVANPIMPLAMIGFVFVFVGATLMYFVNNSRGVEFFVATEPEQAIVYVLARGNLSLTEKDDLLEQAEDVVRAHPGVATVFAFAGDGGLNANTGGATSPGDTIGQMQIETIPWETRPNVSEPWFTLFGVTVNREVKDPALDGDRVLEELTAQLGELPGIKTEILNLAQGPASGKPVHLRLKGDDLGVIAEAAGIARAEFERTPGLTLIEDTRPLPGIDWQIDVDVEKAGRYGADVATVGAMVQLVTRGILLDTYTPDGGDEEIEIRVRLPEEFRVLNTLDSLKVRTNDGLVPLANFITRQPVPSLALISRVDQERYYDVKADELPGFVKLVRNVDENGASVEQTVATLRTANAGTITIDEAAYRVVQRSAAGEGLDLAAALADGDLRSVPVNANERIAELTKWLETDPFPDGVTYEWTGDQEEQAESGAFLQNAFAAALGLMFIILLAQFNSFYNAVLVLLAVILSTTGVLIGMVVMDQTFSIIMTGTGIVALAGIVVNNNIVLIDTYQEYERYMPRIEAIIRTAQDRIRPVLLTTITTMAGLAPMMFGLSIDFGGGGYTVDSPTALWWKQLATAVVFGLGIATVLTLMVTPSMLALRVWVGTYAAWLAALLARLSMGRASRAARDFALNRDTARLGAGELIWDDGAAPAESPADGRQREMDLSSTTPLRAAE
ncbi:MAG: efflux RND transporter permease subunit [Pseudomonadota bacterium]